MDRPDIEHRTEIRRAGRGATLWIGLAAVATLAAVVLLAGRGDGEAADGSPGPTVTAPPTSETLTTTAPRELPPVFGITETTDGLQPVSTRSAPATDRAGTAPGAAPDVEAVVATDGIVVVLDPEGSVLAGEPGQQLEVVASDVDELHPSNEPAHVWLRRGEVVELVNLRSGRTITELSVGDERILGPASFGVVTVAPDATVRWHRPSFEPAIVRLPEDRRPIASGGERLLLEAPALGGRVRLEVGSIIGNGLLHEHVLADGIEADGVLSPDGSVVAVPDPGGWVVRNAVRDEVHGSLPPGSRPVWVGGTRFATVADGRLFVSDSGELPLRWPLRTVAEQSP